jgi:hypothetical protein
VRRLGEPGGDQCQGGKDGVKNAPPMAPRCRKGSTGMVTPSRVASVVMPVDLTPAADRQGERKIKRFQVI